MKRQTTKLLKKLSLLVVLLTAATILLTLLGKATGEVYKDGAALVCENKRDMIRDKTVCYKQGKKNILFMGSSRILAGILPLSFDKLAENKTYSYNLALPALPISSSYFLLKDFLEQNPPPQGIVLSLEVNSCRDCTVYNYYAVQGVSGPGEMSTLMANVKDKSILLNYIFPFRMYKYYSFEYLHHYITGSPELRKKKKYNRAVLKRTHKERGYFVFADQNPAAANKAGGKKSPGKKKRPKPFTQYDPFADPFVEKFFDLTQQHGIKVLLIQPVYRENQFMQVKEIPMQFRSVMERYKNVRGGQTTGWKLKLYHLKYFSDSMHVNRKGAERYTAEIFAELVETFPDLLQ